MSFFIIENLCNTFWWSFGRTRVGFGGCRSGCSLLPSRSLRVVQVARAFVSGDSRATSGRVWPKAWRPTCHAVAGRRIPSQHCYTGTERRCDTERRQPGARCSAAAAGRRGAGTGAGLRCLDQASQKGRQVGSKIIHWLQWNCAASRFTYQEVWYLTIQYCQAFIGGPSPWLGLVHSISFTLRLVNFYWPCHVASRLFVPALWRFMLLGPAPGLRGCLVPAILRVLVCFLSQASWLSNEFPGSESPASCLPCCVVPSAARCPPCCSWLRCLSSGLPVGHCGQVTATTISSLIQILCCLFLGLGKWPWPSHVWLLYSKTSSMSKLVSSVGNLVIIYRMCHRGTLAQYVHLLGRMQTCPQFDGETVALCISCNATCVDRIWTCTSTTDIFELASWFKLISKTHFKFSLSP